MTFTKSLLLGSAAALTAAVGAQAADLPSRKAAPVEYVKVCDAYGAGFFFIPGTSTCLKVGGYVRVDYDYRPRRDGTGFLGAGTSTLDPDGTGPLAANAPTAVAAGRYSRNIGDYTTNGFYNRGTVQVDARTQTAWGTVQTVMALRLETGSGVMDRTTTQSSLEAAYVRFAGFTFGQASQPFAFASAWAWNTPWAQGWPNGVRQIAYTHVFGGGFSATLGATDARNYNSVTSPQIGDYPSSWERTGVVWVGNLRYDQSWGSAQIMGAYQRGGNLAGGASRVIIDFPTGGPADLLGTRESGWAVGAGLAVNLPMLASGDRLELQAVYHDRLQNFIGDPTLNSPSGGAYITAPLGGPNVNFANGKGYSLLAQMRHYWLPTLRSQLYVSYTDRKLHAESDGVVTAARVGAKGNALGIGHALVWSPVSNFDIGLELTYLRSSWNQAAARLDTAGGFNGSTTTVGTGTNPTTVTVRNAIVGGIKEDAFIGKVRVQRNF